MGARQLAHLAVGIKVEAKLIDDRLRLRLHGRTIEHAAPRQLAPEEQILLHGEFRRQAEFLEDRADSEQPRGVRRQASDRLALVDEGALVRRIGAGDDVDQRGFAGAVFAEENVRFAEAQIEIDAV